MEFKVKMEKAKAITSPLIADQKERKEKKRNIYSSCGGKASPNIYSLFLILI